MDPCYLKNHGNCLHNSCPEDHECCTQLEQDGKPINSPTYGLCVKKGRCNHKTGLCNGKSNKGLITKENYSVRTVEGYDGDCDDKCNNWRGALWVLVILVILLIFIIINLIAKK